MSNKYHFEQNNKISSIGYAFILMSTLVFVLNLRDSEFNDGGLISDNILLISILGILCGIIIVLISISIRLKN